MPLPRLGRVDSTQSALLFRVTRGRLKLAGKF